MFLKIKAKPTADLIGITEKLRDINLDLEYIQDKDDEVILFYDIPQANFETQISDNEDFLAILRDLEKDYKISLVDDNIPIDYTPISIYWDDLFYVEARLLRGAKYHKRDQIVVEARIRNISNKEIVIENTNQYIFKVSVLDLNRNELKSIEGAELEETYEIILKPSEERKENFKLSIKVSIPTFLDVLVSTEYLDIEDKLTIYQLKPMKIVMK